MFIGPEFGQQAGLGMAAYRLRPEYGFELCAPFGESVNKA